MKSYIERIGFDENSCKSARMDPALIEYINFYLSALGEPIYGTAENYSSLKVGASLMAHYHAKDQWLQGDVLPPVDQRVEKFLSLYLGDAIEGKEFSLPGKTMNLPRHGMARQLSVPAGGDKFESDIISSYRLANGVLHNPASDRRTTKGVFHVVEGGLPIPNDKKQVPKITFARLLRSALNPPKKWLKLPFLADQEDQAHCWVSLLLRPVVCPAVPGFVSEKTMEVRFFAPGTLVSNLDFVESIFGNAGDPFLPENDAGLDVENWSGTTGCVILAPHLIEMKKKDLGLPHVKDATDRQKRDGMCWEDPEELYNDGGAFKITARDESGTIVTLIADNYFGYCKKEVKTQISYSANLFGMAEEEHAGGTLAFTTFDLGEDFRLTEYVKEFPFGFDHLLEKLGGQVVLQPEGYAVDSKYPNVYYVPNESFFSLRDQSITWEEKGKKVSIKLLSGKTYVLPFGYKVQMKKPARGRRWRLIGTMPEPVFCHKPCTVSGGGKSEISKPIADAIIHAPFYVNDLQEDLDSVEKILNHDFSNRYKSAKKNLPVSRSILSPKRSLGSVIKLLTSNEDFTDEHNAYLDSIPSHIKELVLLLKRFYKASWGENWRDRFAVDIINGRPGHELKYRDYPVITSYLRVGYSGDGSWRVFSLRKDFAPATKIQMEDDISASVTVPSSRIHGLPKLYTAESQKVVQNCEYRLFQRPDDAIIRGYDKKTEEDMSTGVNFFSNYEPLDQEMGKSMVEDAVRFDYFTEPMKSMIEDFVYNPGKHPDYIVCSANPRIVDGSPTKNPRYLQTRPTLEDPESVYLADIGVRLSRNLSAGDPVLYPVTAFLPGRRNNPSEGKIRALANFNPIHYLPLPEAMMEFISSMTGKSPSTTGAGSEGALTKAPFNAVLPIVDLNNALLSLVLTDSFPFITAAGYVGPKFRVDHDVSLLVPELWCRMKPFERHPQWLIDNGFLEPVGELEHNGKSLNTSILGYRITRSFILHFLGRIFSSPEVLFEEAMLKPELQGMADFADGIDNMVTTHRVVANNYFEDGSISLACPPLKMLLHIMRDGEWEGKTLQDEAVRSAFTKESIVSSDWYAEHLLSKQKADIRRWEYLVGYLDSFHITLPDLEDRRAEAKARLKDCQTPEYLAGLKGTIGRQPQFDLIS